MMEKYKKGQEIFPRVLKTADVVALEKPSPEVSPDWRGNCCQGLAQPRPYSCRFSVGQAAVTKILLTAYNNIRANHVVENIDPARLWMNKVRWVDLPWKCGVTDQVNIPFLVGLDPDSRRSQRPLCQTFMSTVKPIQSDQQVQCPLKHSYGILNFILVVRIK